MDTNLKGTFFLSQKALAIMDSQGSGQIVNVTSDAGITGNLGRALYCASKREGWSYKGFGFGRGFGYECG